MPWKNLDRQKAYEASRKDRNQTRAAAYYRDHKARLLAYHRTYRKEHLVELQANDREYYWTHRNKILGYNKGYRAQHADTLRRDAREYAKTHAAEFSIRNATRRATKRTASIGNPAAIKAIYRRARETKNVKCYLCGKLIPLGDRHVDHVVPLSKGGPHSGGNLAITHKKCNLSKNTKLPNEIGLLL